MPKANAKGRVCAGVPAACLPLLISAGAAAQFPGDRGAAPAQDPTLIQQLLFHVARMQSRLNAELTEKIQAAQEGESLVPALAIIGAGFLYGVLHAAGPGHGKAVVATYFLTHRAQWLRGITTGFAIAAVQAVTAILLVSALAVVLGVAMTQVLNRVVAIELLSYGLIAGLGLFMLYRAATGQAACGHDHGDVHAGHKHKADAAGRPGLRGWIDRILPEDLAPLAVAVGIRPCSGAIIVLLFTLANGIFLIGAIATFSMALGTALVVSLAGMLAIAARQSITAGRRSRAFVSRIQTGVTVAGALVITGLGGLMFAAALQRGGLLGL